MLFRHRILFNEEHLNKKRSEHLKCMFRPFFISEPFFYQCPIPASLPILTPDPGKTGQLC